MRIKEVTRRAGARGDPLVDIAILQRTINRLRGGALVARGVFRFRTHEEADEWMIRQIAATHVLLSSKTS